MILLLLDLVIIPLKSIDINIKVYSEIFSILKLKIEDESYVHNLILSLIDKDEKCLIYFAKNISYLENCLFNDNR